VKSGEIVGVAGVEGTARGNWPNAFPVAQFTSGSILINDIPDGVVKELLVGYVRKIGTKPVWLNFHGG
jgi:hypothetical protein